MHFACRNRCAALLAAALFLWPHASAADDLVDFATQSRLAARLRWVRYAIIAGRLQALDSELDTNLTATSTSRSGYREQLAMDLSSGAPSVSYAISGTDGRLSISLRGGHVSMHCSSSGGKTRIDFTQNPGASLSLVGIHDGQEQTWRASSIWELLLMAPNECRRSLVPIAELLRPGWNLASQAVRAEHLMLRRAGNRLPADPKKWTVWVNELRSAQFARREAAERQLRAAGTPVIPYLEQLDRTQLETEQLARISRILIHAKERGGEAEDTVDAIVDQLLGNAHVWLAIARRGDLERQCIAARQLASILGEPVNLETGADAATVERQLKRLELSLGSKRR